MQAGTAFAGAWVARMQAWRRFTGALCCIAGREWTSRFWKGAERVVAGCCRCLVQLCASNNKLLQVLKRLCASVHAAFREERWLCCRRGAGFTDRTRTVRECRARLNPSHIFSWFFKTSYFAATGWRSASTACFSHFLIKSNDFIPLNQIPASIRLFPSANNAITYYASAFINDFNPKATFHFFL